MMLFQVISILSFLTLLPVAILVEGTPALPASLAAKVCRTLLCSLIVAVTAGQ